MVTAATDWEELKWKLLLALWKHRNDWRTFHSLSVESSEIRAASMFLSPSPTASGFSSRSKTVGGSNSGVGNRVGPTCQPTA